MRTPSKFSHSQLTDLLEASGARLRPPVNLEAPLPEQGEVLKNRFHVGAFLGSGGMGLVFQGKDLETGARIVIKTLRTGATHKELQRFVKEAALKLPEIPNIVRSIAHFVCDQRPYYVQEHVEGHNLADILHTRHEGRSPHNFHEQSWFDTSLAIPTAVEAAAQISDALQELHDRGIVHRDVKPANLVWSDNERPVLIDFGLALNQEDESQSKVRNMVGTSAYLAPELAAGGVADGRSDIYSLGVTLWQLLTGVLPMGLPQHGYYFGSNLPIDADLLGILQTALEPNRKFRFARASSFAEALRDWLHDEKEHSAQKFSVSIRRWIYFRRFELALSTSIVAVAASIMLAIFVFNYRVESEAERRTDLVGEVMVAISEQDDFLVGKVVEDQEFVRSLFAKYNALLADKDELSEEVLRDVRGAAFKLGIRSGSLEEIEPFLCSNLGLELVDFADAQIEVSILSGLGQFVEARRVLLDAKKMESVDQELLDSTVRILELFAAPKKVELEPDGLFARFGFPKMPIVTREGTVCVARFSEAGEVTFEPISSPNAFPFGRVTYACSVRGPQGELGRLFFFDPRDGDRDTVRAGCGIYWQPSGASGPPRIIQECKLNIGLSEGLGLIPIDIDGDGQDEVLAPFSNSAAKSYLLHLEGDQWNSVVLPGKGGDVHGVHYLQEGGRRQLAIATSQWNEQHQGFRIRTFDFSRNLKAFSPGLNLPLGAFQSWELLHGWSEHSVATYGWVDDAQFFGEKYDGARAGEIWSLIEDPEKGLVPFRKLGETIKPKRLGSVTGSAISLDLDNDGRDEIYWTVYWGVNSMLTAFITDPDGDVFRLPLGIPYAGIPRLIEISAGIPTIFFPSGLDESSTAILVQGTSGNRDRPPGKPINNLASRVFTVRGEGPVLEGDFLIPAEWKPGKDATWFEADLRLVRSDFDSFAYLALEMEDADGVPVKSDMSLAMRVVGGGRVYEHRLGAHDALGNSPPEGELNEYIQMIPGGWVHITIGPSDDGQSLDCRAVQEGGTPGGPRSCEFKIALQPRPGTAVHWDWRSSLPNIVVEARDASAVLAWDWLGPGDVPQTHFALSETIIEAAGFGSQLVEALKNEDEAAFDRARARLKEIMGGPRLALESEDRQNSLARYYLEEYGELFLKRENALRSD